KSMSVAALRLGAIQRDIRLLEQLVGVLAPARSRGYADARADDQMVAFDLVRLVDEPAPVARGRGRFFLLFPRQGFGCARLVAAEPCDGVAAANAPAEAFRHGAQKLVADPMAERIVDVLEMIEVDVVHGDAAAVVARLRQRLVQQLEKLAAVDKPGEGVVLE